VVWVRTAESFINISKASRVGIHPEEGGGIHLIAEGLELEGRLNLALNLSEEARRETMDRVEAALRKEGQEVFDLRSRG